MSFTFDQGGRRTLYRIRYINMRGEFGPWTAEYTATFTRALLAWLKPRFARTENNKNRSVNRSRDSCHVLLFYAGQVKSQNYNR